MEIIWFSFIFVCIAWGIISSIVKRHHRDKAAHEILDGIDFQKEKEEILSINYNFVPKEMRCPECNGILMHRIGKFGQFWGCNNFPKCHFTKK